MDSRTRNLAVILALSAGAMLMLLGISTWFDENTRLDAELASLQKRARLVSSNVPNLPIDAAIAGLEARLRPSKDLPTGVAFAAQVRDSLRKAGLSLEDFAVQEEPGKGGRVRVQLTGSMAQWLAFQADMKKSGPVVYRSATFDTDQGRFHMTVVVGYAAHP